jgi:hypothetical protein
MKVHSFTHGSCYAMLNVINQYQQASLAMGKNGFDRPVLNKKSGNLLKIAAFCLCWVTRFRT